MKEPERHSGSEREEQKAHRVWIENVRPCVDGGKFPIKRTVGEKVTVRADIFADGHDVLAARLQFRSTSESRWNETPMSPLGNDLWEAEFSIPTLEPHHYTVVAWVDVFATWQEELRKKHAARQDVTFELLEGAALVEEAAERAQGRKRTKLLEGLAALQGGSTPQAARVAAALEHDFTALMASCADRSRAVEHSPALVVDVDRERARFGAWYEMFPRSLGTDTGRHGNFRDAEARLGEIARMGFDVVYLPPIHPIGRTHRKGPNNTTVAGPSDPGSPWAIGAEQGGHTSVHPELGALDDFTRFLATARQHGMEVALDMALQCSPDHPWVREHPEWFRHRPDGSIKYAENPPKRYQDIYPLDFECDRWRELWGALRDVMLFWAEHGVRIFRVDNPHTKPLRFWQWVLGKVRARFPDIIFLSEAFTRPKVMYALAKVGFSQSYTYFTWRNTKGELTEYLTELTQTEAREFFRPNFFTNTPDILPEYLQFGGRAAFLARLVLAATLGASYGIYSGFELCEAEAVPGTEEYLDSEKYQLRQRDWKRPGNLCDFIARVNAIRRENPALTSNERLRFHPVDNPQLLFFSKTTADMENTVLVVVNLDPHHVHDGWVEVPIDALEITEGQAYQVHDLMGGGRYLWQGSRNYVRLDPASSPAQIFQLRRRVRRERDFDYFM